MTRRRLIAVTVVLTCLSPSVAAPANAADMFAGIAVHDIDLGVADCCRATGRELQFGVRGGPIARVLKTGEMRPHLLASINTGNGVSFAALGISLRFPLDQDRFYVQPGIGVAIHDGSGGDTPRANDRPYLGARFLFEPELTVGWRFSERWAAELAFVHLSHAEFGGPLNPGLDTIGVRLAYRLGN